MHTLTIASGKRGGGKSVAIANLVKKCKDKNYFDRCYLITPTYNSNRQIWAIADIEEEDVFEPDICVIKTLICKVEAEKKEWDAFLERKKLFAKFKKEMENKPIHQIPGEDLIMYMDKGFFDQMDSNLKWKYDVEQPPRLACIIDDCLGTDVMAKRTAGLTNLCIRHRHIADGLGLSLFMLVQSYVCHGGVPRPIRENCTNLLLFRINDENQIKKVKEECDLPITDEEWTDMCDHCHNIPFNFLFIDFNPKCNTKRFRSGFDEYIVPPSLVCDCKSH